MRRYAATVALLTSLAGCGGGDPAPRATPSPTVAPTTASPSPTEAPEAAAVRAAVAKTLAACPCSLEVAVWTDDPAKSYQETLRGVYDAKRHVTELRQDTDAGELVARYVGGRAFVSVSRGAWVELAHSGLPASPATPLVTLAVADPRLQFAVVGAVTVSSVTATSKGTSLYEVEFDVAAAAKAAGPWGPLVKRLTAASYGTSRVWIRNGLVTRIEWNPPGTQRNRQDQLFLTLDVKGGGAKAPAVSVPTVIRTRDVATDKNVD